MSRISLKKKDKLYRLRYLQNELKFLKYKLLSINKLYTIPLRKKKGSTVYIHNRCLLNNCSKAVFSKYKLNRISLREEILRGNILGVKKASW